jgi:membrane associated rhomboid family serine protease
MPRSYPPYGSSIAFGPGPLSQALKALIGANVAVFLLAWLLQAVNLTWLAALLALIPADVVRLEVWRLVSYMFLHVGPFHLLFNMLALWMFGTDLERTWGTRYFLKFYFVTGVGAAVLTTLFSLLPFESAAALYRAAIMGASGAIYGLLLAYGMYFPDRPLLLFMVFPVPARYAVMIFGVLAFIFSLEGGSGVANATHLAGLIVGYFYLKRGRIHPIAEAKYWYLRWKMVRTRKKFDVYSGGRANDWNRRVH